MIEIKHMASEHEIFRRYIDEMTLEDPDIMLREIISNFFAIPSPILLRDFYVKLYSGITSTSGLYRPGIEDLALTIRDVLLYSGLVTTDAENNLVSPPFEFKYSTYEEICNTPKSGRRALVTGAFDPLHTGHMQSFKYYAEHCEELVVGLDSNEFLSERKGGPEDPRPRYPQLGWRMLEASISPYVKSVFMVPKHIRTAADFDKMTYELRADALGSGRNNTLLENYKRRMQKLGGIVLENPEVPLTSSLVYKLHSHPYLQYSQLVQEFPLHIQAMESIARKMGYLADQADYEWME